MPKITHFTSLSLAFDAALRQFKALDLGMSDEERYPSCGIGCYDPKKKTYPSIYLSGPKDDFMDLPDSGEAVAIATMSNSEGRMTEFARGDQVRKLLKKTGAVPSGFVDIAKMRKTTHPGQPWPAINDGPDLVLTKRLRKAVAEGVREIRSKAKEGYKFSEFNRPRDGDGQFVANVTGGADPVTMRQAYGPDPKKSKLLAPGTAAAALGGAGLLGTSKGRLMAVKGAKGAARVVRSAVTGIQRKAQGRSTERYPIMGSKAPKGKPGFGETLMRQRMRGD